MTKFKNKSGKASLIVILLIALDLIVLWYLSPHKFRGSMGTGNERIGLVNSAVWGRYVSQTELDKNGQSDIIRKFTSTYIPLYSWRKLGRTSADEVYVYKIPGKKHWSEASIRIARRMDVVIEDSNQDGTPERCFLRADNAID